MEQCDQAIWYQARMIRNRLCSARAKSQNPVRTERPQLNDERKSMQDPSMIIRDVHSYEPAKGHGLQHDPFYSIIAPRPIGWMSPMNAAGDLNLAPSSFFNAFSHPPPLLAFASTGVK